MGGGTLHGSPGPGLQDPWAGRETVTPGSPCAGGGDGDPWESAPGARLRSPKEQGGSEAQGPAAAGSRLASTGPRFKKSNNTRLQVKLKSSFKLG